MLHFQKTQRGINVLQDRSLTLTARQRQLLVLIGSEDFDLLNESFRKRLARPELLDQLCEMGLIIPTAVAPSNHENQTDVQADHKIDLAHTEIHRPVNSTPSPSMNQKIFNTIEPVAVHQELSSIEAVPEPPENLNESSIIRPPALEALSFTDLKEMMVVTLQKYCGLLAKQQIHNILQAQDLSSLKLCQIQWLTSLQESRIHPQELHQKLQQINFSYEEIQQNSD